MLYTELKQVLLLDEAKRFYISINTVLVYAREDTIKDITFNSAKMKLKRFKSWTAFRNWKNYVSHLPHVKIHKGEMVMISDKVYSMKKAVKAIYEK